MVKIAYEGVCDGGTSLSMAMELVNSLSVMQRQPPQQQHQQQNPQQQQQQQSAGGARVSEPSLIDHLGVENDPFDLNPTQSSSSSVSRPTNR